MNKRTDTEGDIPNFLTTLTRTETNPPEIRDVPVLIDQKGGDIPIFRRESNAIDRGGWKIGMSPYRFLLILLFCSGFASADLAARFELAAGGGGGSFDRHFIVVRHGRRLDAMVLVAPATIRAPLTGFAGNLTFRCLATPVFNIGDGMQMDVLLKNAAGERMVYTRYFDAARRAEDRDWMPLSIPLDLPEASTSELIIRLSGGPQGDLVADWLALASVHLTQRSQSP